MMTKRKIEIVAFERERIVMRVVPTYCAVCQLNTELLTTRQAGALAQVKSPSIYRWLAQGKAHGVKTSGGQYRICKNSLFYQVHFPLPQGDNRFAYAGDQP
ncbi:MAG TPA: helix-turn-helix domain-containing protein [Blastocatellia bacterium]|nr:helix-turn-helix domain-containing protein [Blastocatellia bacterium]